MADLSPFILDLSVVPHSSKLCGRAGRGQVRASLHCRAGVLGLVVAWVVPSQKAQGLQVLLFLELFEALVAEPCSVPPWVRLTSSLTAPWNSPRAAKKDNLNAQANFFPEFQLSKYNHGEVSGVTLNFWSIFGAGPGCAHVQHGRIYL